MKTVWILDDATTDNLFEANRTDLLRNELRMIGMATRVVPSSESIAGRVMDGDIVIATFFDERMLELQALIKKEAIAKAKSFAESKNKEFDEASVEVPIVHTALLVHWDSSKPKTKLIGELLHAVDITIVRSAFEKKELLARYPDFADEDVFVIGGLEDSTITRDHCKRASWEARADRVIYVGKYSALFDSIQRQYEAAYPEEKVGWIDSKGRFQNREEMLEAISLSKVIISDVSTSWPGLLIEASFQGVFILTPKGNIFDELRIGIEANEIVTTLHSMLTSDTGPKIAWPTSTLKSALDSL